MTMKAELTPFKNQFVRDLAWALGSPGMLDPDFNSWNGLIVRDSTCNQFFSQFQAVLFELDHHPEALLKFIADHRKSGRLGNYFESLIHYWLSEIMRCNRVETGIPVRENGKTLGELDFIFRQAQSAFSVHWEVAVKFYMCIASTVDEAKDMKFYVGQKLQDRLDLKIARSFNSQLKMPEQAAAKVALENLGLDEPESQLLVKGRLFYPVEHDWENHPGPNGVSPHHLRGWWSAFSDQETLLPSLKSCSWIALSKGQWLSPVSVEIDTALMDESDLIFFLKEQFDGGSSGVQVAQISQDRNGAWQELTRGFVLPRGWPSLFS